MLENNIELHGACVLVTGAAGFIGSNLVMELIRTVGDIKIIGLDSVNDYYDPKLRSTYSPKSRSWLPHQRRSLYLLKAI